MSEVNEELAAAVKELVTRELPQWVEEALVLRKGLAEASNQSVARREMTYEEFLAWADEDTLAEWIALPGKEEGEVLMMSPASGRHQDLVRFLTAVLGIYVETRGLGMIRPAPFQMKLAHGREPDLLFVATEHLGRLREAFLDGPADVVIEIISPESVSRDRGEKFYEYEAGGVREYWLIDPLRQVAEFYCLGERGHYGVALAGREGVYRSEVLAGFWLRVEWLWQEPLPKTLDVLRELGLL
ncbi:MAG: Uma2 family endonuclease [Anaerolineae bacterium]|jgi:Uma2 family endonuclease